MKRQTGFVRWYDKNGDAGILTDFEGNEHYFNSWSFPKSVWGATGICKKTGKKKTIRTKYWPGMFMVNGKYPDPIVNKLDNGTPVEFEQAKGIEQRWAVKIKLRHDLVEDVWSYRLCCVLDSIIRNQNEDNWDKMLIWESYYQKRLEQLLSEVMK